MIQFAIVFVERFKSYLANSRSCLASGMPLTYFAFMIPATSEGVAMLPLISGSSFSGQFIFDCFCHFEIRKIFFFFAGAFFPFVRWNHDFLFNLSSIRICIDFSLIKQIRSIAES